MVINLFCWFHQTHRPFIAYDLKVKFKVDSFLLGQIKRTVLLRQIQRATKCNYFCYGTVGLFVEILWRNLLRKSRSIWWNGMKRNYYSIALCKWGCVEMFHKFSTAAAAHINSPSVLLWVTLKVLRWSIIVGEICCLNCKIQTYKRLKRMLILIGQHETCSNFQCKPHFSKLWTDRWKW